MSKIRERCEKATEGPWYSNRYNHLSIYRGKSHAQWKSLFNPAGCVDLEQAEVDACFVAHARADIPWLLERVEMLQRRLFSIDHIIEIDGDGKVVAGQEAAEFLRRSTSDA